MTGPAIQEKSVLETPDWLWPGNFQNLGPDPEQDLQKFENLGPIWTGQSPNITVRESLRLSALNELSNLTRELFQIE